MKANVAGIGRIFTGEDAHQRRLSRSIRPNEADAFAVKKLEGDIVEQRSAIESPR
jgi:hypothetical protein